MIKNGLADVASDEDYYPVRRRGEKRRLNPNRDAIEWLENDTLDLTDAGHRYLMTDLGFRLNIVDATPGDDCVLVTRAYGSHLATHHKRPMFECFDINASKALTYRDPCPECDNLAYSFQGCQRHNDEDRAPKRASLLRDAFRETQELIDQISAPTLQAPADFTLTAHGQDAADGFLAAQERIDRLGEHYQTALYARYARVDRSEINLSWRVNPS